MAIPRRLLLLHLTSLDGSLRRQRRHFTKVRRALDVPPGDTPAYLGCVTALSEIAALAVRISELTHDVLDELREPQASKGDSG